MSDETLQADQDFAKEIVDNGATTLKECIQCGTCSSSCPSGRHTAWRIRKLIRAGQLGLRSILDSGDLWLCTTCYSCYERCPNEVDIPQIIMVLRNMAAKEGFLAIQHKKAAGGFMNKGHLVPLSDDIADAREKMGLPRNPPTSQFNEEALEAHKKMLVFLHFDDLIGGDE